MKASSVCIIYFIPFQIHTTLHMLNSETIRISISHILQLDFNFESIHPPFVKTVRYLSSIFSKLGGRLTSPKLVTWWYLSAIFLNSFHKIWSHWSIFPSMSLITKPSIACHYLPHMSNIVQIQLWMSHIKIKIPSVET